MHIVYLNLLYCGIILLYNVKCVGVIANKDLIDL